MSNRYTSVAKGLHWLMAPMLIGMLGLGFYMTGLPFSPEKLKLYSWHKWAGVTIFMLALIRIGWRVKHPPPALPNGMSGWEHKAAHAGHRLLYALMIVMPLTGWLMSSAKGFQTVWFGVIALPDLLPKHKPLGDALAQMHGILGVALAATVTIHIAAAFKHQWVDRIDLFGRMAFQARNKK